jgi:hypothetical protein
MTRILSAPTLRPVLVIVLVALALAALAIALAPGSHHVHDMTSAALSDGILARFPARFDR